MRRKIPLLVWCLIAAHAGRGQCGTTLSAQQASVELQVADSTVLFAGVPFRLLTGTPASDDTLLTFSRAQADERYIAFHPNGGPAFKEERTKRGYSRTWYYSSGQVRDDVSLHMMSKRRIARTQRSFFRDGSLDGLDVFNDTIDYHLHLVLGGDTAYYSSTDPRKGASPYRVVISNACGKRQEARFYTVRKGRYTFQYFEDHRLEDFGTCEDPEIMRWSLFAGR